MVPSSMGNCSLLNLVTGQPVLWPCLSLVISASQCVFQIPDWTYPWRHEKAVRVKDRKFCYLHTRTILNEKNLSLIVIQPISMVTDSHRGAVGFGASWAFCSTCGKGCCTGSDVAVVYQLHLSDAFQRWHGSSNNGFRTRPTTQV